MSQPVASSFAQETDDGYAELERLVASRISSAAGPLFTTAAAELFEMYIEGISPERRQHYTCRCCRRFIEKFWSLAHISEVDGEIVPLLGTFGDSIGCPGFFRNSFDAMSVAVRKSKVTGVLLSADPVWGTPSNIAGHGSRSEGTRWTHLHGANPKPFKHLTLTPDQAMAEKLQDYIMLKRGLDEFPVAAVEQAVRVLEADALDRSEKTLGVAKWLLDLHRAIEAVGKGRRDNVIWLSVAKAPPGFCHVRSTMISTLLDDIVAGLPYESIAARWKEKMHPLQYQRPTTVKAGNIERAEKLVATMGIASALDRRFAKLTDVVALWAPKYDEPVETRRGGGVFDHLKAKSATVKPVELPAQSISWEKFQRVVLPGARKITFTVPSGHLPFFGLVTALDPEAKPILQWDGLEGCPRNPVSWYFYHGGSPASNWGLTAGERVEVSAVFLKPPLWHQPEKFKHQGEGAFFALKGCRDLRHDRGGMFFPETLRSEFHEVRSVMEAHAQVTAISGKDDGDANGIAFQNGAGTALPLIVDGTAYIIDRWD